MTDQADTPDPIGECGDVPTRPDLWLPCDRQAGHTGPHTWALNPAYTPAVAAEGQGARRDWAASKRLYDKWVACFVAAREAEAERDSALAELAAARDREAAVRALHREVEWHACGEDGTPDLAKPLPSFCGHCTDPEYVNAIEYGDTIDAEADVAPWPCPTIAALEN